MVKSVSDKELIKNLGGVTKLAKRLGLKPSCVGNWGLRGIPSSVKVKHPDLFLTGFVKRKQKKTDTVL